MTTRWKRGGAVTLVLAAVLVSALLATLGGGPADEIDYDNPQEVHGKDVGKGLKQWVFVFRQPSHANTSVNRCDDGDQLVNLSQFSYPKLSGMTFNIGALPSYLGATDTRNAMKSAFGAWDAINTTSTYFTVNDTGGASKASKDGNNTVAWRKGGSWLALASVWSEFDPVLGAYRVVQADVFYNSLYSWGLFGACTLTTNSFDVGAVGTHEFGHTIGKSHLSDEHRHATMYPSAYPGQIKNRTITTGETGSPNLP